MDGALVLAMLMLFQLDWIVHSTLYNYNLSFSLGWAVPYWTASRTCLGLLGLTTIASTILGYGSYRKARKESEKIVLLCKSCGNAWTELDRSVRIKRKLPKFKILESCPSCDKKFLNEQTTTIQTDTMKAHVETPALSESLKTNKSQ